MASLLQQKKITIVGTVRNNNKGMTKCGNDMYGRKFYYNEQNGCLFVYYQCKKKKNVNWYAPSTDNTEKKKPLVIHFYNKNKVGVDVFDQMARQYTTHSASRRWLLAVWTNVLDIAALNAWIIFRKTMEVKLVAVISFWIS